MTVIVTGAGGFIGRAVVRALSEVGRSVLATDRVEGNDAQEAAYIRADLADQAALVRLFERAGRGAVLVHLAWEMRRHQGFAVQGACVSLTAQLLDAAAEHGVARVIGLGSADEYGAASGVIREDVAPMQPFSPYGWAKRAARDLAAAWRARNGIPVIWLRPFIVYGPGQRGDLMIPYAIEQARSRRPADFTDGEQRRDFVYIDDLAAAVRAAVDAPLSDFNEFNIGRGEPVCVRDVLTEIARHFGVESLFHLGARPRRPGEADEFVADITAARSRLAWEPRVSWREGISRACASAMLS